MKVFFRSSNGFKFYSQPEYACFIQLQISIPCWDHRLTSVIGQIKVHETLELKSAKQIRIQGF